jgi:glycosyltransferase involved in cell wall biosynthesis
MGDALPKDVHSISESPASCDSTFQNLRGRHAAVVVFSHYPSDPRPRREAEALVQQGMEVDVISIRQDDCEPQHETFNGVNILRVPLQHWRGGKFSYFFQYGSFILASFFLLAFRSFNRRYSLIHIHNMPDVLVFAALVPKIFGAKVILDLHDPMPELMMTIYGLKEKGVMVRLLKMLECWSIRFADVVLTPNAAFMRLFGLRSSHEKKIHVVMNSPDENIFTLRELPTDVPTERDKSKPFIIMYHGALLERHGLDLAVQSVEMVKGLIPNVQLHVFGRPTPYVEKVMQLVQSRGLQGTVRYFGARNLEEIVVAIDKCDLGIIPNRRSVFTEINMPTRIFEYLSRGKPVIVPSTVGIRDYFTTEGIIFFERGDAEELAQKLLYVFSHPREVCGITRRAQAVYLANRWRKEQTKFVTLTSNLLNGRNMTSLP